MVKQCHKLWLESIIWNVFLEVVLFFIAFSTFFLFPLSNKLFFECLQFYTFLLAISNIPVIFQIGNLFIFFLIWCLCFPCFAILNFFKTQYFSNLKLFTEDSNSRFWYADFIFWTKLTFDCYLFSNFMKVVPWIVRNSSDSLLLRRKIRLV